MTMQLTSLSRSPEISATVPSLCPVCLKAVDARIFQEGESVMIEKHCSEHGDFKDIYWSDASLYRRFMRFKLESMNLDSSSGSSPDTRPACPADCGLCENHRAHTLLGNIDVTNRCNLSCPICFADAGASSPEPSLDDIRAMMKLLADEKPSPCYAVQFSGGEPTLRDDLPEMVSMARDMGFTQIQVASNGLILSKDAELCRRLVNAGLCTVYLQFDGVTEEPYAINRGRGDLLSVKLKAIENLRAAGLNSVVLVPTVVKGVNDGQLGDIVKFASEKVGIINGIVYQPVSFAGRIDAAERLAKRITIPDVLARLEEQTDGEITKKDFYPVSFVDPIARLIEKERGLAMPVFSAHPCCGAGTYVYSDGGRLIPITRFLDVEGLLEWIRLELADYDESTLGRLKRKGMILRVLPKFIDNANAPADLNFKDMILAIFRSGTTDSLASFAKKSLFVGIMHFQDLYNLNLEKLPWCAIHYALPDGRLVPFCSYNTVHRSNAFHSSRQEGKSEAGGQDENIAQ